MASVTISPKDVSELRARTGAGMMDCKKALEEANGDMDKAGELLRARRASPRPRSGPAAARRRAWSVSDIHRQPAGRRAARAQLRDRLRRPERGLQALTHASSRQSAPSHMGADGAFLRRRSAQVNGREGTIARRRGSQLRIARSAGIVGHYRTTTSRSARWRIEEATEKHPGAGKDRRAARSVGRSVAVRSDIDRSSSSASSRIAEEQVAAKEAGPSGEIVEGK